MRYLTILLLAGCASENQLQEPPKVPPPDPPELPDNGFGNAPNWADCTSGWLGRYTNLSADHPDMEPADDAPVPTDPDELDWWDRVDHQEFVAGLDFGTNWWPMDDGLEGDPAYFAVSWVSWLRATDNTTMEFIFGSSDDAWIHLDGTPLAELPGVHPFQQNVLTVGIDSGQFPLLVRYAHRSGPSGFRFRVLSGEVQICYPDFEDE